MGVLSDVRRRRLRGAVELPHADVFVGRFNCPEIAEWCREKREKDEAEGVVRV